MSTREIAIVNNLPAGGGKKLLNIIVRELLNKGFSIDLFGPVTPVISPFVLPSYKDRNLENGLNCISLPWMSSFSGNMFNFRRFIEKVLTREYCKLALRLNDRKYKSVLIFSDWMVMVPPIFRWLLCKNIYFAFEFKREFYERTNWPGLFSNIKEMAWKQTMRGVKTDNINDIKLADKVSTISLFMASKFRQMGISKKRISWHYPPVDILKQSFNGKYVSCDSSNKPEEYFLTVGSLNYTKGLDFLIDTISVLPPQHRLPLVIVTPGNENRSYLEKLAIRKRVTVKIMSSISWSNLRNVYQNSKVFLFAPRGEPFGFSLLEAIKFGIPTVSINEGGPGEIINHMGMGSYPRDKTVFAKEIMKRLLNLRNYKNSMFLFSKRLEWLFPIRDYINYVEYLIVK